MGRLRSDNDDPWVRVWRLLEFVQSSQSPEDLKEKEEEEKEKRKKEDCGSVVSCSRVNVGHTCGPAVEMRRQDAQDFSCPGVQGRTGAFGRVMRRPGSPGAQGETGNAG